MKDPLYFSPLTNYKKFCRKLKPGIMIDYSLSFDPKIMKEMFRTSGIEVKYMPPGTKEYQDFGSTIMKVISIEGYKKDIKPVLFDTSMLDL